MARTAKHIMEKSKYILVSKYIEMNPTGPTIPMTEVHSALKWQYGDNIPSLRRCQEIIKDLEEKDLLFQTQDTKIIPFSNNLSDDPAELNFLTKLDFILTCRYDEDYGRQLGRQLYFWGNRYPWTERKLRTAKKNRIFLAENYVDLCYTAFTEYSIGMTNYDPALISIVRILNLLITEISNVERMQELVSEDIDLGLPILYSVMQNIGPYVSNTKDAHYYESHFIPNLLSYFGLNDKFKMLEIIRLKNLRWEINSFRERVGMCENERSNLITNVNPLADKSILLDQEAKILKSIWDEGCNLLKILVEVKEIVANLKKNLPPKGSIQETILTHHTYEPNFTEFNDVFSSIPESLDELENNFEQFIIENNRVPNPEEWTFAELPPGHQNND